MKIWSIDENSIVFDNGNAISYDHLCDCCEWNYADFKAIDDTARSLTFDEDLKFEEVPDSGFRFGNNPENMVFVPCYSVQNGYYSSDVDIYYNEKNVLNVACEMDEDW